MPSFPVTSAFCRLRQRSGSALVSVNIIAAVSGWKCLSTVFCSLYAVFPSRLHRTFRFLRLLCAFPAPYSLVSFLKGFVLLLWQRRLNVYLLPFLMLRKLAFIILPTVEGRFVNANGAAKFRDAVSVLCYKFTNTLYYFGRVFGLSAFLCRIIVTFFRVHGLRCYCGNSSLI